MDASWPGAVPSVMGHESAGIVQAVGKDVSYVKPGDHVITCLSVFCGNCNLCLTGRPNLCRNNGAVSRPKGATPRLSKPDGTPVDQFARLGGFAEEMLIHQNAVVKIRPDMPLDRAALIGCGVTTGVGAVFKTARIEPGSTVAVFGAGGIGLSAVQGARIAGAGRIISVDVTDDKLETARAVGATDTVNGSETDAVMTIHEMTGGGVDYAFECIGLKATCEQAWSASKVGGTTVIVGMMPLGEKIEIPGHEVFMMEKRLQGSMMGSNSFRVDMPRYVDMYLDGRLMLDEMISSHIKLDQINEGYEQMRQRVGARTVVDFG
jgi:S-(hydroxymethyl)glutathione dehydrogenase/alcohol dehydrogenase